MRTSRYPVRVEADLDESHLSRGLWLVRLLLTTRASRRGAPGDLRLRWVIMLIAVSGVLLLAGCAAGPNPAASAAGPGAAGFWQGLWHGLISPVTFIVSLFNDKVSVYEVVNTGHWYDAGFMAGVCAVFSGAGRGGASTDRSRAKPVDRG